MFFGLGFDWNAQQLWRSETTLGASKLSLSLRKSLLSFGFHGWKAVIMERKVDSSSIKEHGRTRGQGEFDIQGQEMGNWSPLRYSGFFLLTFYSKWSHRMTHVHQTSVDFTFFHFILQTCVDPLCYPRTGLVNNPESNANLVGRIPWSFFPFEEYLELPVSYFLSPLILPCKICDQWSEGDKWFV